MGQGTAIRQPYRIAVSAAYSPAGEQPHALHGKNENAWFTFREQLREDLEATNWFNSRAPGAVPYVVDTAQRALMAANCIAFLSNGHNGRPGLHLSRVPPAPDHTREACAMISDGRSEWQQCPGPMPATAVAGIGSRGPAHSSRSVSVKNRMSLTPGSRRVRPNDEFDVRQPHTANLLAVSSLPATPARVAVCVDIENRGPRLPIETAYGSTIHALSTAIDFKDPYTCGHSQRVALYSVVCASVMELTPEAMSILETAAILHDIGKIGIDDAILRKPGTLTAAEHLLMQDHPVIGAALARHVGLPGDIVQFILHHHERHDGRGYPYRVDGRDVPYGASIIAVADAFDSMTTGRPYRKALTVNEAMRELLRCRGTQFRPETLDAFAVGFTRHYDHLPWPTGVPEPCREPAIPAS